MKRTALALLLLLSGFVLLGAQETIFRSDGRLPAGDQVTYELSVEGGSNITVRVASVDFQPEIEIFTGGRSASSLGSQGGAIASATVREGDTLRVSVKAQRPSAGGHFLIRVDRRGAAETLSVPATVEGSLDSFDMVYADRGGYIDWYQVDLQGSEGRIGYSVSSMEFDTYLVLRLPNGEELFNDDASGSDSMITRSATDGVIEVGVTSYGGESTGSYTLSISELPPAESLSVGETVEDTLGGPGLPMRTYVLSGEEGEAVELSLSSDAFDTVLEVTGPRGITQRNDDDPSGTGTDSRLLYVFPANGEAEVTVRAFGGGTGRYRLSVGRDPRLDDYEEMEPGALIEAGDEVVQMLGPGDPSEGEGSFYQEFRLEADRGDLVELTLRSSDFDAYLEVVGPEGTAYSDDDSAGGRDSLVSFRAPASGEYRVIVTSYFGSSSGLFTLSYNGEETGSDEDDRVVDLPTARDDGDQSEVLVSFQGRLSQASGEPENVHLFQARQGDQVRIELSAASFSPRFELRGPSGHTIATASGAGRSASLSLRLPEDGEYTIVCGSEDRVNQGRYTVTVYAQ